MECRNAGILENWVLEFWMDGLMISQRRDDQTIQNRLHPLNTQYSIVPLFHNSMLVAKAQASMITHIFIQL